MQGIKLSMALALALAPLATFALQNAHAAPANPPPNNTLQCEMSFNLSGWSVIYKTANGNGTVTCSNGESMKVDIAAKGAGLTVGVYELDDGHGEFAGLSNINDVLGTYATATAHAGVVASSRATAMTKGSVSLALTGTGHGWNIGAGFSGFTISRAKH